MTPVKRVEVIIDAPHADRVRRIFDDLGLTGWTLIKDVYGKGKRGERLGDELTDVFTNSYFLTTCDDAQLSKLADALRPLLKKHGGACIVTEALWLDH